MPDKSDRPKESGSGGISQNEADALLGKADAPPTAGPAPAEKAPADNLSDADIDALLSQAAGKPAPQQNGPAPQPAGKEFTFEKVQPQAPSTDKPNVELLKDVGLNIRVELGRRKMFIEDILKLGKGSVVELDKLAGDPLDILVNDKLVAQGEVLVLNENFCIRITRIISPDEKPE